MRRVSRSWQNSCRPGGAWASCLRSERMNCGVRPVSCRSGAAYGKPVPPTAVEAILPHLAEVNSLWSTEESDLTTWPSLLGAVEPSVQAGPNLQSDSWSTRARIGKGARNRQRKRGRHYGRRSPEDPDECGSRICRHQSSCLGPSGNRRWDSLHLGPVGADGGASSGRGRLR